MTRKRARHLLMELARRMYLQRYGGLKGWGEDAKFYDRNWKPDINKLGGYKSAWESEIIRELRKSCGM